MISHGLRAFQVLSLLCTPSSAQVEDPITVQSKHGESMDGVILTVDNLEKAKAELEHTIEALQSNAINDIKKKAAEVSKRTEETNARFEAAKELASKKLAEHAQLVERRWQRISVQSFHNRLGKCCCRHIDPGAPATPDCHWEAYDKGGPNVDFACHDGYKDYLEALPADEMAGKHRFLASAADALLDQCSNSEGWSLKDVEAKAEPSTKRSMELSVEVTHVEVNTTDQVPSGKASQGPLQNGLTIIPSTATAPDQKEHVDLSPREASQGPLQDGLTIIPNTAAAPDQEHDDLFPKTALEGVLPQDGNIPRAVKAVSATPDHGDAFPNAKVAVPPADEEQLDESSIPPELQELFNSMPDAVRK